MKNGGHKRNAIEIKFDTDFALLHWHKGFTIRDIAYMLTQEHITLGKPNVVSYSIVQRDIAKVIAEAKKQREKGGIAEIEELIERSNFLYNDACVQQHSTGNPLFMNIASKQIDQLAKLKGLQVDKTEITLKYDISIE